MAAATITHWEDLPVTLTIRDVMAVLGVCKDSAHHLTYQRGFPSFRVGKNIRIPRDGFRQWLEQEATNAEDEQE